eukprot:TRINITY_DN33240_c0_g1_i1.p1 TRINITY_DN33240_c0_g1~~TRINITY_DN33240_c0_g1_i1.p1  ORF type:complete len:997 (+),score=122.06 TRINITY_DN33240_c0_g1_i1:44-2992(+)
MPGGAGLNPIPGEGDAPFDHEDLAGGPVKYRKCTDVWCIALLFSAWAAYLFATLFGVMYGDITKLYRPRDFSGQYCGASNSRMDLTDFPKLSFTMNLTSTLDLIVKKTVCSSSVKTALVDGYVIQAPGAVSGTNVPALFSTKEEKEDYLCACCLIACAKCGGSLPLGKDLSTTADVKQVITGKLGELQGSTSPYELFLEDDDADKNTILQDMWNDVAKYFQPVCLPDCNKSFSYMNSTNGSSRTWDYNELPPDHDLKPYLQILGSSADAQIVETLDQLKFQALPESVCPYPSSKCIPMPGIEFAELAWGYCNFKMAAEVASAVGSAVARTLEGIGSNTKEEGLKETFGRWTGMFVQSLDALLIVCAVAFVVGFLYLALLRLALGCCLWLSVLSVFVVLVLGGVLSYIRCWQCAGEDLVESGQTLAVASVVAVQARLEATVASYGTAEMPSENLTGDGFDYRGAQHRTKSGQKCIEWGSGTAFAYIAQIYPDAGLQDSQGSYHSYCRNPYRPEDEYKAKTIWCFTENLDSRLQMEWNEWEECLPIGVTRPYCEQGYAISSETLRYGLEILAYLLWVLAFLYLLLIVCITDQIQLAIAQFKVGSLFLSHNPWVLLITVVQAILSLLWAVAWALSAAFVVSQVPDWHTPIGLNDAFSTYELAHGNCTGMWPAGRVYKDEDNCIFPNVTDPRTGLDSVSPDLSCWKCSAPRYTLGAQFVVSVFVFLWNNALLVAVGQFLIASCVCSWFFVQNKFKGLASSAPAEIVEERAVISIALKRAFLYHMGSLAFGAFVIATVEMIRLTVRFYEKQAKAQKNWVVRMILCALYWCVMCAEGCLNVLNKNAYIQIALMGTPFCTSAKRAFHLLLRNAVRFGALASLSKVVHFIGTAFMMTLTVGLGVFIVSSLHPDVSLAIPAVAYLLLSYLVATLFSHVYAIAVDACLQCFLVCEERGNAKAGEDGFVPNELAHWLDKDHKPEDPALSASPG